MTRSDCVREIMSSIKDDDIVVASTGYISREVFKYDRDLNFYMMGSMGNALSIGIGISLNTDKKVIVINGDGSALMSLGSIFTASRYCPENLIHIILDNNCHESTGGQYTHSQLVRFDNMSRPNMTTVLKIKKDNVIPPRITLTPKQITERFQNAIRPLCNK